MNTQLGASIREARKAASLTQTAVARRLHIEQQTYSAYETGRTIPSLPTIGMLWDLFGCSHKTVEKWVKLATPPVTVPDDEDDGEDLRGYLTTALVAA